MRSSLYLWTQKFWSFCFLVYTEVLILVKQPQRCILGEKYVNQVRALAAQYGLHQVPYEIRVKRFSHKLKLILPGFDIPSPCCAHLHHPDRSYKWCATRVPITFCTCIDSKLSLKSQAGRANRSHSVTIHNYSVTCIHILNPRPQNEGISPL